MTTDNKNNQNKKKPRITTAIQASIFIGPGVYGIRGYVKAEQGWKNKLKGIYRGITHGFEEATLETIKDYLKKSSFEVLQRDRMLTLSISNPNYRTETIVEKIENRNFLYASLTRLPNEGLEAKMQLLKDGSTLEIELHKAESKYSLSLARYKNRQIFP